MIQRRRYGQTGFAPRLGVNAAERAANALYAVWVLVDSIDATVRVARPVTTGSRTVAVVAGVVCALMAVLLGMWARIVMGAAWRTSADGADTGELVTAGPFSAVRNPVYVSMLALAFGVTLLLPDALTAIALGIAFVGLELQVRAVEEPHLTARYGDTYVRFAAATGRFLPLLGRLR